MTTPLEKLTADMQTVIKGALKRAFDGDSLTVDFHHETVAKLNEVLEPAGMSVCGMSYTESEISITLEFDEELTSACGNNLFNHAEISIINSGDFDVELDDDALESDLSVRVTTPKDQHLFGNATSQQIDLAADNLQKALQTKLLKM